MATKNWPLLVNSTKINTFVKKPVKGGIPAIEKKIIINDKAQILFF
jgi:hypothetical protein